MNSRPTQFGVRENTASSRQHDSRLAGDLSPSSHAKIIHTSQLQEPAPPFSPRMGEDNLGLPLKAALLTVQQVAELLQVPVSRVYERVRKRSLERLPGYRLGKYWRFREAEVLMWVERQRAGARSNA
jgi:excisionase family DNA binding protein